LWNLYGKCCTSKDIKGRPFCYASKLLGAAFVSAVLLVAIVTTATFAQGTGPVNVWPKTIGGQRLMPCLAPITPTQQFTTPGIVGYSQSGQGDYGPG